MKRTLLHRYCPAIVLLVVSSTLCYGQKKIDLSNAIDLALTRNKTLARSSLSVKSFLFPVERAKVPFRVKIIPDGSAGIGSDDEIAGVGLRASKRFTWGTEIETGMRLTKTMGEDDLDLFRGKVHIEIGQPLLRNFGPLVNTEQIKRAESRYKEVFRLLELEKADLVVLVVQNYMDLLRLERLIDTTKQVTHRLNKLSKLTRARETRGLTTRVDSLRVELQLGQSLARLDDNKERYQSRMRGFAELLGKEISDTFELEAVPFIEEELPDVEKAIDIAMANRLDYAQVIQNLQDTERDVRIRHRSIWPSLRFSLRYERRGEGEDMDAAFPLDEDIWFVGLTTDTEVLRAEEYLSLYQASTDREIAAAHVEVIALAIAKQVQQHLLAYRRAHGQVILTKRNVHLAKARRDLARKLFEMGRGDNFSVTDAEEAYLTAEDRLLSAQVESTVMSFRLRRALGTLIEVPDELKLASTK